jgi:hypothetical protein
MTQSTRRFTLAAALFATVLTVPLAAGTKFTTTWKAPGAGGYTMAGQKIAIVAITTDQSLRMSVEESLARALTAQGVTGVASYRLIPVEELKDKEKAQAWFARTSVKGVIAIRLIDVQKSRSYTPVVWTSYSYYGSFYDYYAWATPIDWRVSEDTTVALEMLLYGVNPAGLFWAGTCETTNPPKSTDAFAEDVVKEAVKQMQKQGLVTKGTGK